MIKGNFYILSGIQPALVTQPGKLIQIFEMVYHEEHEAYEKPLPSCS
jgi:hypothetical protein